MAKKKKEIAYVWDESTHAYKEKLLTRPARERAKQAARIWSASLPPSGIEIKRIAKTDPCPDCGGVVINWYAANPRDPGDVDPRADCTNPTCDWGF